MLKNNQTTEEAAQKVLRSYLIRCFAEASRQYPEVSKMSPENGADELLRLEKDNMIEIRLTSVGDLITLSINRRN